MAIGAGDILRQQVSFLVRVKDNLPCRGAEDHFNKHLFASPCKPLAEEVALLELKNLKDRDTSYGESRHSQ